MWKIIRRWGKVLDVFVSRRLNQRGHRFGFIRFQHVDNVQELAKQLDNIWIRNLKFHVNLLRYRRQEGRTGQGVKWKQTYERSQKEGRSEANETSS